MTLQKAARKKVANKRPLAAKGKSAAAKPGTRKTGRYNPLAQARIAAILDTLARTYPNAECALKHRNPWELLVATILSAQCTDARVQYGHSRIV